MKTITPVLSILIAILLGIFYVQPRYEEAQAVKSEIAEYQKATDTYTEFNEKLQRKFDSIKNRTDEENNRLAHLAPDDLDATTLVVDLEDIVKKQNMLFGNVKITEQENTLESKTESVSDSKDELVMIDVAFSVIGTYEQFKNLLRTLEQSLTIFEITNISFRSAEDSIFMQFDVSVRAFGIASN